MTARWEYWQQRITNINNTCRTPNDSGSGQLQQKPTQMHAKTPLCVCVCVHSHDRKVSVLVFGSVSCGLWVGRVCRRGRCICTQLITRGASALCRRKHFFLVVVNVGDHSDFMLIYMLSTNIGHCTIAKPPLLAVFIWHRILYDEMLRPANLGVQGNCLQALSCKVKLRCRGRWGQSARSGSSSVWTVCHVHRHHGRHVQWQAAGTIQRRGVPHKGKWLPWKHTGTFWAAGNRHRWHHRQPRCVWRVVMWCAHQSSHRHVPRTH